MKEYIDTSMTLRVRPGINSDATSAVSLLHGSMSNSGLSEKTHEEGEFYRKIGPWVLGFIGFVFFFYVGVLTFFGYFIHAGK